MRVEIAYQSTLSPHRSFNTALDLLHETITVAELIAETVHEEIQALQQNQQLKSQAYLTETIIDEQAQTGKIATEMANKNAIDVNHQVKYAYDAFKAQKYVIFVDGQQATDLSEEIVLKPTSKIVFLRLMPLQGG